MSRSAYRRPLCVPSETEKRLIAQMLELAEKPRCRGYRKLHAILVRNGWVVNHKRVYRLYRELKLSLKRKPRKRLPPRLRQPLVQPEYPNQTWSLDFMSDSLYSGRKFRTLNIIDDFNREALWIEIDTGLPAARVIKVLEQLKDWRGLPERIRLDNGPELISKELADWAETNKVDLAFIEPGKPAQNAYIERFNRTYREECLSQYAFDSILEARTLTQEWLDEYNLDRPHQALNNLTPVEFLTNRKNIKNKNTSLMTGPN